MKHFQPKRLFPLLEGSRSNALAIVFLGFGVNAALAALKILFGITGNSQALIADGIESCADVITSSIVLAGVAWAARPADKSHPFGHGKAESLAGLITALALFGAAGLIAWESIQGILTPHLPPKAFTLWFLGAVIILKEWMCRKILKTENSGSTAIKADAWHHRSDALTSLAAFLGISLAVFGGKKFASADDWAALVASIVIIFNGIRLLRPSLDEILDASAPEPQISNLSEIAASINGVKLIEKCRVRKSGIHLHADLHVQVDPQITVFEGHTIAHAVQDALKKTEPALLDIVVHIEPFSLEKVQKPQLS